MSDNRKNLIADCRTAQNQAEFNERNNGYLERQRIATERIAELETQRRSRHHKARILENFIKNLVASPVAFTEFDEKLWTTTVDRVTVETSGSLVFRFLNGDEITG